MADLSAKSFMELVQRAGIVAPDRLKQALADLSKQAAGRPVKLDELTKFLIAEELITPWHYEKLITGKYKGFFIGQFKLLALLGSGGMSSVYLAEHMLSGHRRAIKVLPRRKVADKSYLDRFYREGRAAASLNHPNIVRIYDLSNESDIHFMVMEYVNGVDLFQKVRDSGPASVEEALDYLSQAAEALSHAHARKVVHRDIKPANLLLAADGSLKILDLGLALLRDEDESLTLLHNEKVMGTADYLAPEQAVNSHDVDHRADIYSLGCTLYYLLTGSPPFPEGTIAQRIAMHQSIEPKPIIERRPDCPRIVQALCTRMIKKNPAERIQNCAQLLQAIEQCRAAIRSSAGLDKAAPTKPSTNKEKVPATNQDAMQVHAKPIKPTVQVAAANTESPVQAQATNQLVSQAKQGLSHSAPPVSSPVASQANVVTATGKVPDAVSNAKPKQNRGPAPATNQPAAKPKINPTPTAAPKSPQVETPETAVVAEVQSKQLAASVPALAKPKDEVSAARPTSPNAAAPMPSSPVADNATDRAKMAAFAAEAVPNTPRGKIAFDDSHLASQLPAATLRRRRAKQNSIHNSLLIGGIVLLSFVALITIVLILARIMS